MYPAGFVYLFDGLRRVTGDGDVPTAQLCFAALYLLTQAGVMTVYIYAQVNWQGISTSSYNLSHQIACTSWRIPSAHLLIAPGDLICFWSSACLCNPIS